MLRPLTAALLASLAAAGPALASTTYVGEVETGPAIQPSIPVGTPQKGSLIFGRQLADQGTDYFTWDFPLRTAPNRPWRRWGADSAIDRTLAVLAAYRAANPLAPRVGIADISRPSGGPFGSRYGGLGHASHQNGLDFDVLYPRRDGQELVAPKAGLIDRALAQDLVNRFVAARALYVFVGPRTRLGGPRKLVARLVHHDDHMHVRWRP